MKVKDLINKLQSMPQDAIVVHPQTEYSGVEFPKIIHVVELMHGKQLGTSEKVVYLSGDLLDCARGTWVKEATDYVMD